MKKSVEKHFAKLFVSLGAALALVFVANPVLAETTLHPGDKISVNVYNHPELATTPIQPAVIDASGRLWMPLAGLVDASDVTPDQLARRIAARLAPYVREPAVTVTLVSQAQSVFVTGAAGGVYPFTPGESLIGALSQIQQTLTPNAATVAGTLVDPSQVAAHELQYGSLDLHRVVIRRDGHDMPLINAAALVASGNPGPTLQPDDTIELALKPIAVTVRGDVRQPGIAHLDADQPISDALQQVGGADDASAADLFELTRGGSEQYVTKSSPAYREPAQQGDIVYVPHGIHVGVLGQVNTPGRVLLQGDQSLLSALYFAGGPTKYGDIRQVHVLHQGTLVSYDVTRLTHGGQEDQNPMLTDGDTVFVPEGHKIDFGLIFQAIIAGSYLRFI